MNEQKIDFRLNGSVAYIKLNRPDVLNSFDREMSREMQLHLRHCEQDTSIRAIVITGEGRAFCAGQDLKEAISGDYSIEQIVIEHYNPIVELISTMPKPVIAAVNGVAAGAGANLALACDLIIANEKASFIQAFSSIGLIPDTGGTYFLPKLMGLHRAKALAFLAEKLTAEQAYNYGLVYKVTSLEQFDAEVKELAERLADLPTKAIGLTKQAFNLSYNNDLATQLQLEAKLQAESAASYDYKEGVAAFLEKRKPNYRGQ